MRGRGTCGGPCPATVCLAASLAVLCLGGCRGLMPLRGGFGGGGARGAGQGASEARLRGGAGGFVPIVQIPVRAVGSVVDRMRKGKEEGRQKEMATACRNLPDEACAAALRAMKDKGYDIRCTDPTRAAFEPVHWAANRGLVCTIRTLVELGADVDAAAKHGQTPLSIAAARGHLDAVELLLQEGASTNKADVQGWTPLHQAAHFGRLDILKALLEAGASLDQQTTTGQTACQLAQVAMDRATPAGKAGIKGTVEFLSELERKPRVMERKRNVPVKGDENVIPAELEADGGMTEEEVERFAENVTAGAFHSMGGAKPWNSTEYWDKLLAEKRMQDGVEGPKEDDAEILRRLKNAKSSEEALEIVGSMGGGFLEQKAREHLRNVTQQKMKELMTPTTPKLEGNFPDPPKKVPEKIYEGPEVPPEWKVEATGKATEMEERIKRFNQFQKDRGDNRTLTKEVLQQIQEKNRAAGVGGMKPKTDRVVEMFEKGIGSGQGGDKPAKPRVPGRDKYEIDSDDSEDTKDYKMGYQQFRDAMMKTVPKNPPMPDDLVPKPSPGREGAPTEKKGPTAPTIERVIPKGQLRAADGKAPAESQKEAASGADATTDAQQEAGAGAQGAAAASPKEGSQEEGAGAAVDLGALEHGADAGGEAELDERIERLAKMTEGGLNLTAAEQKHAESQLDAALDERIDRQVQRERLEREREKDTFEREGAPEAESRTSEVAGGPPQGSLVGDDEDDLVVEPKNKRKTIFSCKPTAARTARLKTQFEAAQKKAEEDRKEEERKAAAKAARRAKRQNATRLGPGGAGVRSRRRDASPSIDFDMESLKFNKLPFEGIFDGPDEALTNPVAWDGADDDSEQDVECGIGLNVGMSAKGEYFVREVVPNGPADISRQIRPGDIIYGVGDIEMKGQPTQVLASTVVGRMGTSVKITVQRNLTAWPEFRDPSGVDMHTVVLRRFLPKESKDDENREYLNPVGGKWKGGADSSSLDSELDNLSPTAFAAKAMQQGEQNPEDDESESDFGFKPLASKRDQMDLFTHKVEEQADVDSEDEDYM